MIIKEDFQLKDITTFHLPAKTKYFCEYETLDELIKILKWDILKENKVLQIGGGSNLVFTTNFDGVILHSAIKYLEAVEENDDWIVFKVGSGVVWDDFVSYCVDNDYYGAENMSYIPGEVGASAVQNIGSYGAEVKDIIHKVHAINIHTLEICTFDNAQCKYGYRDSVFKNELKDQYIVIAVEYKLSKTPVYNLSYGPLKAIQKDDLTLEEIRNEIIRIRIEKLPDPKYIGSVGSFFKNPIIDINHFKELQSKYPDIPHYDIGNNKIKIPAGWLIEKSGLKGESVGDAQVYPKQCLVIVNNGLAKSIDVVNLYSKIIDTVESKYGITLSPEANIL